MAEPFPSQPPSGAAQSLAPKPAPAARAPLPPPTPAAGPTPRPGIDTATARAPLPPPTPAPSALLPTTAKKKPDHLLQVGFDDSTWAQVENLAAKTGTTRAGFVRRAIRILALILKKLDEGYDVAFIKKGENPILFELS